MPLLIPQQELVTVDSDVKTKFNQYNAVKTNLASLQRRQQYAVPPRLIYIF